MATRQRRRKPFYRRWLSIAWAGSFNSARSWAGIVGAATIGVVQSLTGYEIMFAGTISGGIAHALMWIGAAWILIFGFNLLRAWGTVKRRDRPILIMFGSDEPFYTVAENENLISQAVGVGLKNISDIYVRHLALLITDIKPAVATLPICLRGGPLVHSGDVEYIIIGYFHKGKKAAIRQLGICTPLLPVYGGNILTVPEDSYDIMIEVSCDDAEESQLINCRLWIDERDVLRLAAR